MRGEAESWNQSAHGARGRTGTAGAASCVVAVTWGAAYSRSTSAAWATPVSYDEDTWFQLATTKAFAMGSASILSKTRRRWERRFRQTVE